MSGPDVTAWWASMCGKMGTTAERFVHIMHPAGDGPLAHHHWTPFVECLMDTHPGLAFLADLPEFRSRYCDTVIARLFYTINRWGDPLPAIVAHARTHTNAMCSLTHPGTPHRCTTRPRLTLPWALASSWSGEITAAELQRSRFFEIAQQITSDDDINNASDFFSYEHFYVIYTTFWKLDRDRDLEITREVRADNSVAPSLGGKVSLMRCVPVPCLGPRCRSCLASPCRASQELGEYGDRGLPDSVLDRLFSGHVLWHANPRGTMAYWDFVWFMLSEEDKATPTSVEYWFRVLDADGQGVLTMFQLEELYRGQVRVAGNCGLRATCPGPSPWAPGVMRAYPDMFLHHRATRPQVPHLSALGCEPLPFGDCICLVLDMVAPRRPHQIS